MVRERLKIVQLNKKANQILLDTFVLNTYQQQLVRPSQPQVLSKLQTHPQSAKGTHKRQHTGLCCLPVDVVFWSHQSLICN